MNLQWYPGHMTKAKRQMQEDLKLIDLIIELVDARIPLSSRNPDIDELGKNKARLILLNKSDLADERYNEQWSAYFQKKGFYVVKVNAKSGAGLKSIQGVIQEACKAKIERDRRRGIKNRPIRAMVVGIPNVGKAAAKTIMKRFPSILDLEDADRDALMEVDDVGEVSADCIFRFFHDEKNKTFHDLLSLSICKKLVPVVVKLIKKANVTGELNISDVESYANFCVYGQLGILTDDNLTPEEKNRKIKAILFDLFKL